MAPRFTEIVETMILEGGKNYKTAVGKPTAPCKQFLLPLRKRAASKMMFSRWIGLQLVMVIRAFEPSFIYILRSIYSEQSMVIFKFLLTFYYYRFAIWQRNVGTRFQHRVTLRSSEKYLTRILILNPQHHKAQMVRGIIRWRELDDWQNAIKDFGVLVQNETLKTLLRAEALFYRSMAYYRGGNYAAAIDDLERMLKLAPQSKFAYSAETQLKSLYLIANELPEITKKLPEPQIGLLPGEN